MVSRGSQLGEVLYGLARLVVRRRQRDISLTAASALSTLERNGPRRLGDLALSEGVTQPSMTAVVAALERLELAERRADPDDGRAVLVAITEQGSRYLAANRRAWSASFGQLIDALSHEDAAALEAAMPALRRLLELASAAPELAAARRSGR